MNAELIVNVNGKLEYLDVDPNEVIDLIFNIADIAEPTERKTSYSKTISLLDTANNRRVFDFLNDFNAGVTFDRKFNPNKRVKAYLIKDSIEIFPGYLQLKEIVTFPNKTQRYEVVIYADTENFYSAIGDKELTDLDFSDLNHTYSLANVYDSWFDHYKRGYYYPFIDYGNGWNVNDINGTSRRMSVRVTDLFPALYVKTILDKCFSSAGFTYQSDFLNSDKFYNLVIPYNGNGMTRKEGYRDDNLFRAAVRENNSGTYYSQRLDNPYTSTAWTGGVYYWMGGSVYNGNSIGYLNKGDRQGETIRFSDEVTGSNFDSNGVWNDGVYEYTCTSSDVFRQRFSINLDLATRFQFDLTEFAESQGLTIASAMIQVNVYRSIDPYTGTSTDWNNGRGARVPGENAIDDFIVWQDGTNNFGGNVELNDFNDPAITVPSHASTRIKFSFNTDWLDGRPDFWNRYKPLQQGEKIRVVIRFRTPFANHVSGFKNYLYVLGNQISGADTHIRNEIDTKVIENQIIDYNNILPQKVKQKDFIKSLCQMFNLYIEPDKEVKKMLRIEPRDDFYKKGGFKDWTTRVDYNKDIKMQVLGDVSYKDMLFSYKDDKDYYNSFYKSNTEDIYGQKLVTLENDFVADKKSVSVIFSPTPMVKAPKSNWNSNLVYPVIAKDGVGGNVTATGKVESNIRILYRRPITLQNSGYFNVNGIDYGIYPYAGHFDDPIAPTFDLNFGQCRFYFYSPNSYTLYNLFFSYYKKMLEEVSDVNSRLVTLTLRLTPNDLASFRFNDKIYIELNGDHIGGGGQYYKVNKLSATINPKTNIAECTAELIRTSDYTVPTGLQLSSPNALMMVNPSPNVVSPTTNPNAITTGTKNDVDGTSIVVGTNNKVSSDGAIVTGNGNIISHNSNGAMINGDNNIIGSNTTNVTLLGNNNVVIDGVSNVLVMGNDITVRESNTTITANDNSVDYINLIDCGEDCVTEDFNDSVINLIDCGEDQIVEKGLDSTVNLLDSGEV
ncbi:MAG: hypothetical protein EOO06_00350 [Chitinophagaceae bacterium]|nr:MAG: hypothetical protein EOO06_00350 [Chitinophagaceae bacterium]